MPQVVEIVLRIPSLRIPGADGGPPRTINNTDIRFTKQVEVEAIPKPGVILPMSAGDSLNFSCEVLQANWHESKNAFVVACRFNRRTIAPVEYETIINSNDWTMKPLL
jgi:hypothetical protein